jgi:phosphoserine phosphatase
VPAAVVFFDVDGTLVPGTSSSQYLARHLGHLDALARAEADWNAGLVGNVEIELMDARVWAGTTTAQVRSWLEGLPLVDGIDEVVSWCRAQEVTPVLATLAWAPVTEFLCERFGFAPGAGPALAIDGPVFTGEVARSVDEFGKRDHALAAAREAGVRASRCAAIGDSRSDAPLFAEVGLRIAFNASSSLRPLADVCLDGNDLRAVVPFLEQWLSSTAIAEGGR